MELDRIVCADALDYLKSLPDNSVDCCVSSIPYYGLRDYGTGHWEGGNSECDHRNAHRVQVAQTKHPNAAPSIINGPNRGGGKTCVKCGAIRIDAQIGLEETPQEYVAKIVAIYEEVRRTLKPTGTCWLNIGDSYNAGRDGGWPGGKAQWKDDRYQGRSGSNVPGLKPKDLILIPQRLVIALQDAGWYVRSMAPWVKRNGMPESVTDRATTSHEYVLQLAKCESYWFDPDSIKQGSKPQSLARAQRGVSADHKNTNGAPGQPSHGLHQHRLNVHKQDGNGKRQYVGFNARYKAAPVSMRNRRTSDVFYDALDEQIRHWQSVRSNGGVIVDGDSIVGFLVNSEANGVAHFATFPRSLIEPMILASCPDHVCCICGKPWRREIEKTGHKNKRERAHAPNSEPTKVDSTGWSPTKRATDNWLSSCNCGPGTRTGIVLDPFMGSGTTAIVARKLGRHFIGCDLNPDYVNIARERLRLPFEQHYIEHDNDLSDLPLFAPREES